MPGVHSEVIENASKSMVKNEGKVDKLAVEKVLEDIAAIDGRFTVVELRDQIKNQGFSFGSLGELVDFAEKAKVRYFIGRLVDENGKRKYVATKDQLPLDFGNEYIYCKADLIQKESSEEKENLGWLRKHIVALVRRTPLLPQWAINEIVTAIEKVFEKMGRAA